MKTATKLRVALAALMAATSGLRAATYTLDPADNINDIWVMGDFSGHFSTPPYPASLPWDYNGVNSFGNPALSYDAGSGVLHAVSSAGLPQFWTYQGAGPFSAQWASLPTWATILELRIKVVSPSGGSTAGWAINVGNTSGGPWQSNGAIVTQPFNLGITDNDWHVVQFDVTSDLGGTPLVDWMITTPTDVTVDISYVRLGTVSPDTDGDGLPDLIETGTFSFVNRRETGSYPNNPDSDGDGFNDGLEVSLGTNPCDLNDTPPPGIPNGWSTPAALYIVSVPMATNSPVAPIVGNPTSFAISPPLPGGISLVETTGQIHGTPTTPSANTNYTIVTTFVGGKTATNTISIEVRNPFVSYGDLPKTWATTANNPFQPSAPLAPTVYGPAPTNYVISPSLPAGMSLDPVTGVISGPPTAYKVMTQYTVTCQYAAFPDHLATKSISALEDPVIHIDPANTLAMFDNYQSIGEFDVANDWDPFNVGGLTISINDDGYLYLDQTANVAYGIWSPTLTNDHRVFEMRMKILDPGAKSFWVYTYNESGSPGFHSTFLQMPWDDGRDDGQFHVYQIDLSKASNYRINSSWTTYFAYFAGGPPNFRFQVDYVRFGTLATRALEAALQLDGQVKVSWPASANATLESTTTLPGGWATDPNTVDTDGLRTWILEQPAGGKFYRLIQNGL